MRLANATNIQLYHILSVYDADGTYSPSAILRLPQQNPLNS